MRRAALVLVPLFLLACEREPVAPGITPEGGGVVLDAQNLSNAGGAERIEGRWEQSIGDDYFEPADFPCLTETVHVSGTVESHLVVILQPSGGAHYTLHQTTQGLTAVGMTTGAPYQQSGPYTDTWTQPRTEPFRVERTQHNIIHLVGPGELGNLYLRTLVHVTRDPTTGAFKVMVVKDDALCH